MSKKQAKSAGLKLVHALAVVTSLFAIASVATRGIRGARRQLEAPVAAAVPVPVTAVTAHAVTSRLTPALAATRTSLLSYAKAMRIKDGRPKNKGRSLVTGLSFLVGVITLSLLATTGSYALWNGAVTVKGSTLGTGSIGLTINGQTDTTLGLPTTALAPGRSVVASATFTNTGSVPIKASINSTTITANTNGMASSLTMVATPVAAGGCTSGLNGTSASLASFTTTSAPYSIAAGATQVVCFELKLDGAAPTTVEGGSTSFRMNVIANQVRP